MSDEPKDIISGTTQEVRNAINKILEIEKEHEFTKNLSKSIVKEIENKIKNVIIKETESK